MTMKTINALLTFCFILISLSIQAQDEKVSKFSFLGNMGVGYCVVENEIGPNYNLNSTQAEILLNYKVGQKIGVATGIGIDNLSGTAFNANGNFYHERSLIKIPLLFTGFIPITEKFKFTEAIGFYGQTIINDEFHFLENTEKNIYGGWNFGFQLNFGFFYAISKKTSLGINIIGQSDLTKYEPKGEQRFNGKQKLNHSLAIGLALVYDL
jgi:opacity protein-like surface antigen